MPLEVGPSNKPLPAEAGFSGGRASATKHEASGIRAWLSEIYRLIKGWAFAPDPPSRAAMRHAAAVALDIAPVRAALSERVAQVRSDGPVASLASSASLLRDALNRSSEEGVGVMDASVEAAVLADGTVDANPNPSTPAPVENVCNAVQVAEPPYQPELIDDLLGEVARYLAPQEGQLALRKIGPGVMKAVDAHIHEWKLSAREAVKVFEDVTAVPRLERLTINALDNRRSLLDGRPSLRDDRPIRQFADTLRYVKRAPFALTLNPDVGWDEKSDLSCFARVDLSSLTIERASGVVAASEELKHAQYPIRMNHMQLDSDEQLTAVMAWPTLVSVSVDRDITDECAEAIAMHPALTDITAKDISPAGLRDILRNPRIESLHLRALRGTDDIDLSALGNHPALRIIGPFVVDTPHPLIALSGNRNIASLTVSPRAEALSGVHHLAEMPGLRDLTLRYDEDFDDVPLYGADNLRALCIKRMEALRFNSVPMDAEGVAIAAGARATHLEITNPKCIVDVKAVKALCDNETVTSLTIAAEMVDGAARRLATSERIKNLDITFMSIDPAEEDAVKKAWIDAGKPPTHLTCIVIPGDA